MYVYIYIYTLIHIISTFTATCIYTLFIVIYNRHALISSTYITILFFLQPIIYQYIYIYIAVQVPYNVCVSNRLASAKGGVDHNFPRTHLVLHLNSFQAKARFSMCANRCSSTMCVCVYIYIYICNYD